MSKLDWPDGRALGKVHSAVRRALVDKQVRVRAHQWSWTRRGVRCTKCGARRHRNTRARCTGIFNIQGINEDHRFLCKAVSPDGIP